MKKLFIIAMTLLMVGTFTSCSGDDKPGDWEDNIKLSTRTVDFDINRGSSVVTTGKQGWWFGSVEIAGKHYYPEHTGNNPGEELTAITAEWLTVRKTDGKTILVFVEKNLTEADRSAVIVLQNGNYFDRITVTQTKDGELQPASAKRLLPSQIVAEHSGFEVNTTVYTYKIEYDSENRFSKIVQSSYIKEVELNMPVVTSTFEYAENSIIVTQTSSLPFDESYQSTPEITTYTIGASEVLVNGENPIPVDDRGRSLENDYKYDQNGNLTSFEGYNKRTYKLEYDKNNGIYRYVNMPSWYLTLPYILPKTNHSLFNNCLTELIDSDYVAGEGYVIQYNMDDYPVNIKSRAIEIVGSGNAIWKVEYVEASNIKS